MFAIFILAVMAGGFYFIRPYEQPITGNSIIPISPPPEASCKGYCDGGSPKGCYCDKDCVKYNDCCKDYETYCKVIKCNTEVDCPYVDCLGEICVKNECI